MGSRARSTRSVAAAVANGRHLVGNVSSTGAEKALSKNRSTLAASNITPLLVNLRRISTADNNRLRHHEYAVFIIMLRTIIFRVRSDTSGGIRI